MGRCSIFQSTHSYRVRLQKDTKKPSCIAFSALIPLLILPNLKDFVKYSSYFDKTAVFLVRIPQVFHVCFRFAPNYKEISYSIPHRTKKRLVIPNRFPCLIHISSFYQLLTFFSSSSTSFLRNIFPTAVLGNSSRISTSVGSLNFANLP